MKRGKKKKGVRLRTTRLEEQARRTEEVTATQLRLHLPLHRLAMMRAAWEGSQRAKEVRARVTASE